MTQSNVFRKLSAMALTSANSREYLSVVFAAYKAGDVVVALPAGSTMRSVPGVTFTDRRTFEDDPGWFGETLPVINTDAPAQISFSSGTTGRPKALLLSHRALNDVVTRINAAMGVTEEIREYIGVPVTFSFGFGRARAVAVAGGQSYLAPNGFDPAEIGRMLKAGEINAISAVPTLWRIVLANPDVIGSAGADVSWIEIGSQYMAGAEKAALKALFPNAKIVQHYGLTEASRTTLLDVSSADDAVLDSVGQATGDVDVSISDTGAIRVRGPHLAMGRMTGAGVKPIVDDDGWLTTSDRGRLDNGWLYYEGRTDELINSGGLKIDPTQFEQRLHAALGVSSGIAVGKQADDLRGERVLVAFTSDAGVDPALIEETAIGIAGDFGLTGAGSLALRHVDEIPVTPTGKVKRAELEHVPAIVDTAPKAGGDAADGQARELQALWAEVLGDPDVSLHESFYDLGGDSLSALTVIMRMESMGLDPEVARGIFAGKTIAQIAGLPTEGTVPAQSTADTIIDPTDVSRPLPDQVIALQTLWGEVLGVSDVALDQSFYDLGGDSLSALTAIMRMEGLGLDPDVARGIFDGKTIADLAGDYVVVAPTPAATIAATAADEVATPGMRLTLAEAMNSVHAARGVLVLWVVAVHWLPGFLGAITSNAETIYAAMNPILRFGTPGFAMVFGLGVGALGITQYQRNRAQFMRGARLNTMLIVGGVLLLAFIRLLRAWTRDGLGGPELPSELFYSAIVFYALAMFTMPMLMWVLSQGQNRIITIFSVLVGSLLIHEVLSATTASLRPGGLLELAKIMLTAKYGYFRMMVYVMVGVAIGYMYRAHHDRPGIVRDLWKTGVVLAVFGMLLVYEIQPEAMLDGFGQVLPWHLMVYAGVALVILSGFSALNRDGQLKTHKILRWFNALAIASGILALPIFVGHEMVLPTRTVLVNLGLPGRIGLLIPLGLFFVGLGIAYKRLLKFLVR